MLSAARIWKRFGSFLEPKILFYMAFRLAGVGLAYIVTILVARWLGAAGFGAYSLAIMAVALLAVPFGRGWSTLVLRSAAARASQVIDSSTARLIRDGRILSLCYISILAAFSALAIGLGLVAWQVAALVLLAVLIKQNSAFRLALLRGKGFVKLNQVPEQIIQPTVLCLALFSFVYFRIFDLSWIIALSCFVAALFFSYVCGLALQAFIFRRSENERSDAASSTTSANLSSALIIGLNGLVTALLLQVDTYILGFFEGEAQVGVYRFAMQLSLIGGFVYSSVNYLAANEVASYWSRHELAELRALSQKYAILSVVASTLFIFALAILGSWFISTTVGQEFSRARDLALVLMIGQAFSASVGVAANLLTMSGNERSYMQATLIALAISVCASVALVPYFGAIGAASANVLGTIALNIVCLRKAILKTGVNTSVFQLPSNKVL